MYVIWYTMMRYMMNAMTLNLYALEIFEFVIDPIACILDEIKNSTR